MERRTRSQITMGTSVKQFSVTHPTESSGHQAAVAGLDSVLAEAGTLEDQQREGIITERRGGAVRRGVIDRLWDVHLPHLWAAARRAEREQPDLARTFRLKPAKDTIAARRAAAGSMLEAAQTHKKVLVRYGMDESVLNDLVQGLAEFDAATEGRAADRTCDRALAAPALSGRMDRDDAWRQMAMLAGHWHLRGFGMGRRRACDAPG